MVGFISPQKSLTDCMVAHGVAKSPTWVQVANPSNIPLSFDMDLIYDIFILVKDGNKNCPIYIDPTQDIP
jgi:hypothetical protein